MTCSLTASRFPIVPTFFLETKLRRPSKDGITLVVAGDYTNTESRYITGLGLRAAFVLMTLKISAMALPN